MTATPAAAQTAASIRPRVSPWDFRRYSMAETRELTLVHIPTRLIRTTAEVATAAIQVASSMAQSLIAARMAVQSAAVARVAVAVCPEVVGAALSATIIPALLARSM